VPFCVSMGPPAVGFHSSNMNEPGLKTIFSSVGQEDDSNNKNYLPAEVDGKGPSGAQKKADAVTSEVLWACDLRDLSVEEGGEDWERLLSVLTEAERDKVMRFRQWDDQKRAFLSIQLQRCLIRTFTGLVSDDMYGILRTRENKPYAVCDNLSLGTWNYNVSHHGNYVAIASHAKNIIGVDVMTLHPPVRKRRPVQAALQSEIAQDPTVAQAVVDEAFFESFKAHFTDREMEAVRAHASRDARYAMFFLTWSLKEAFVKAVGKGIAMNLCNSEFDISISAGRLDGTPGRAHLSGTANLYLGGRRRTDWKFRFLALDQDHVLSLGLGPLGEVVDSFASGAWRDVKKEELVRCADEVLSDENLHDSHDSTSVHHAPDGKGSGDKRANAGRRGATVVLHKRSIKSLLSPLNAALLNSTAL